MCALSASTAELYSIGAQYFTGQRPEYRQSRMTWYRRSLPSYILIACAKASLSTACGSLTPMELGLSFSRSVHVGQSDI